MPSPNRIILCAAGGGKTSRIVKEALAETDSRTAILTYTRNNEKEIEKKVYECVPVIPERIEVMTWFRFLLREMARPYRPALHDQRIDGFVWVEGRSVPYTAETNTSKHYFADHRDIYQDKIAKFICRCDQATGGAVIRRLAARFDHIFIDEVQDMAGYDLDILESILKAGIKLSLVGDHRQGTYSTNNAAKNKGFARFAIVDKFEQWHKAGLANLSRELHTHRCNQAIADIGDGFFPFEPKTKSLNQSVTGHDGVFTISKRDVPDYVRRFSPQVLRLDRKTDCGQLPALNFGESKGMTFDRILIFPHVSGSKWLSTGSLKHIEKSAAKMYVGATRARYSLAFVFDGVTRLAGVQGFLSNRD